MTSRLVVLGVLLIAIALGGCSGAERTTGVEAPEWYQNSSQDSAHVTVTAVATDSVKQVAIDKAASSSLAQLADTLRTLHRALVQGTLPPALEDGLRKHLPEAAGAKGEGPQARQCGVLRQCGLSKLEREVKSVVAGITPKRTTARQMDDGTWRAFALTTLPVEQVAEILRRTTEE